jgi:hypothetical protein
MQYYTLIRPGELSHLKIGDISIKNQTVFVSKEFSKNHKDAEVGLNKAIIKLMLDLNTFASPNTHYLFGEEQKTGGEPLTRRFFYGSMMAIGGVFLVVLNGRFLLKVNPLGDALTLLAALFWAFYSMVLRKFGNHYSALFITRKVFFYGIVTILPVFVFSPMQIDWNLLMQPVVAANLLFLSVVASLACYLVWNIVVRKLGVDDFCG